jgi:hypothetical protein
MPKLRSAAELLSMNLAADSHPSDPVPDYPGAVQTQQQESFGLDWVNVAKFGADPSGVEDSTPAFQYVLETLLSGGGTCYIPAGQYVVSETLSPAWNVTLQGTGETSQILSYVTGDTFAMSNPTTPSGGYGAYDIQSGGVRDLLIDGTNTGANSSGLHIGNGLGYIVTNVFARNFTGTGSTGIWVDDSLWWTEKAYFRAQTANCTTGFYFTSTGTGTGSFEYSYYDLVTYWTNGQSAIVIDNVNGASSAFWGGTWNYWRGNCDGSTPGPFLTLKGGVQFKRCNVILCPESNATAGAAQTIYDAGGGTNHFVNCEGWMDFGANTWAASNMSAGNFQFAGPIQGDATLAALRTGVTKPTVTTPGVPAASTNVTNDLGIDVMVYVTGGTAVAVSVNGVATGLAAGSFYVPMGQTINLGAYSAAPSWVWHGGPYP